MACETHVLVTVVKAGKWSMLLFNDLDLKVQTARASLRVLVIMYYDTSSDRFKLVFFRPCLSHPNAS